MRHNLITLGIISLLIGLAIAPSIHGSIHSVESKTNLLSSSSEEETVNISCKSIMPRGIREKQKEITTVQLKKLRVLLSSNNFSAIAKELKNLGLLSEKISLEQAIELINGEYGRHYFKKYAEELHSITANKQEEGDWRVNLLCTVQGEAEDYYYITPWQFTVEMSMYAVALMLIILGFGGPISMIGLGLIVYTQDFLAMVDTLVPLKILSGLQARIADGGHNTNAYVRTHGLLGRKEMQSYDIALSLLGFIGIWLTLPDNKYNEPPCSFMGFSLLAAAQDMEW